MSVKTIDLKDFSQELGDFSKRTLLEQKRIVVDGIISSLPALVAASPVDTGLYAASWDFSVQENSVILGNYAPYAGVIEYGARPFKPPLGPLLAWAKRVTQSPSQPPKYDSRCWALALAVQKKIQAHGMQPRHILENIIPEILENIRRAFKRG